MADFLPEIVVGALINASCTAAVFFVTRRKPLAGVLLSVSVLVLYLAVLWFWPGPRSEHSSSKLLGTYLAIVAVIWCPGAFIAVIAGRLDDLAVGIASFSAGLLLGAGYIFVALAFACSLLGDCL
jgi:hypothetical protein